MRVMNDISEHITDSIKKERIDAAKSEKNDKTVSRKKKDDKDKTSSGNRCYVNLSKETITLTADASGISRISDDATKIIAEDASYKLREILHKSCIFMRHSKRKNLKTSDVNHAFVWADVPISYGHSGNEDIRYAYMKEANVFVIDDPTVDLPAAALTDRMVYEECEYFVKGMWITPDFPQDSSNQPVEGDQKNVTQPDGLENPKMPPQLVLYFKHVARHILGSSDTFFQVVINDLVSNNKINPVAPYILTFIATGLRKFQPGELQLHKLLQAADALTQNIYIDLTPSMSVHSLLSSLLVCIMNSSEINSPCVDDYFLRRYGAQVLKKVMDRWWATDSKPQADILKSLVTNLNNWNLPPITHYGVLVILTALGKETLDCCLWPYIEDYLGNLELLQPQTLRETFDILEVEGAILAAAERLHEQDDKCVLKERNSLKSRKVLHVYQLLYEYFGDSVCARFPVLQPYVSHGSASTVKSPAFTVQNGCSDFEQEYQNWTMVAKMPRKIISLTKCINETGTRKPCELEPLESAFDYHGEIRKPKEVQFCFAGAISVPEDCLRKRRVDSRHEQYIVSSAYQHICSQVTYIGKAPRSRVHHTVFNA